MPIYQQNEKCLERVPNISSAGGQIIQRKKPNPLTLVSPGFVYIVCFRQPISNESSNHLALEPALPPLTVLSVPRKLKQIYLDQH